jgi:hypothetical protein
MHERMINEKYIAKTRVRNANHIIKKPYIFLSDNI